MFRPYILFILAQRSVLLLASKFILDISEEFTDRKFLCVRLFMYCVLLSNLFEIGKFIQGINSSQTQQFITHNSLMATCFDCIESSSGLPKNRFNVSKFIVHSGGPKCLQ